VVDMYSWRFDIILKSGEKLIAYDKNNLNDSNKVAIEYFAGNTYDIVSLGNNDGTTNILIRKSEIAVMAISAD
jgi:hypothetical protein